MPSTGICDYRAVADKLGELIVKGGGEILLGRTVHRTIRHAGEVVVDTDDGELLGAQAVVCGGLHGDELAAASGADPGVRIIPFRGEYAGLTGDAADLVRGLIYPVPDPAFPFLGVHATRGVDGHVHVGPERGPRAGPRGLLLAHGPPAGAGPVAGLPGHDQGGPPALALRPR